MLFNVYEGPEDFISDHHDNLEKVDRQAGVISIAFYENDDGEREIRYRDVINKHRGYITSK